MYSIQYIHNSSREDAFWEVSFYLAKYLKWQFFKFIHRKSISLFEKNSIQMAKVLILKEGFLRKKWWLQDSKSCIFYSYKRKYSWFSIEKNYSQSSCQQPMHRASSWMVSNYFCLFLLLFYSYVSLQWKLISNLGYITTYKQSKLYSTRIYGHLRWPFLSPFGYGRGPELFRMTNIWTGNNPEGMTTIRKEWQYYGRNDNNAEGMTYRVRGFKLVHFRWTVFQNSMTF